MEAYILNKNFETVELIDTFTSFIWTDRYQEEGDFDLRMPIENALKLQYLKRDNYLYIENSPHLMIIESFLIESTSDNGSTIKVVGRSLESILRRRIIQDVTIFSNVNFQNAVEKLLKDAIISPAQGERRIDNFCFLRTDDPAITSLTIDTTFEKRETLYDAIQIMCKEKEVGFKIVTETFKANGVEQYTFVFYLYKGTDRTYGQSLNPWVIFSKGYENLVDSSHLQNQEDYANVCYVTGADTENQQESDDEPPELHITVGTVSGLDRREVYTDAGSLRSEDENVKLTHQQKVDMMTQAGNEELAEHKVAVSFTGEVDPYSMFQYNRDYYMGDRVQVENELGIKGTSVVSEFIQCHDENGYKAYPTFTEFVEDVE